MRTTPGRVVVVGDCLLDVDVVGQATRLTPDAPAPVLEEREVRARPGGAGLAAILLAGDGREVTFVTALSADAGGQRLAAMLQSAGIDVVDLGLRTATPEKIRLRAGGRSLARWDRGGTSTAADVGAWTAGADNALHQADAVLVSCYGRGITRRTDVRAALEVASTGRPLVWDPHSRGGQPVSGTTVATPNRAEAEHFAARGPTAATRSGEATWAYGMEGVAEGVVEGAVMLAEALVRAWGVAGCAVTIGEAGAVYSTGAGMPLAVPAPDVGAADPCGAGDRFAACVAGRLADGRTTSVAVTDAVYGAAAFVAAGGASSVRADQPAAHRIALRPARSVPAAADGLAGMSAVRGDHAAAADGPAVTSPEGWAQALLLARDVAARGGTVVATGGCFDILHTGHIQLLQSARRLGDCLIVCLNADDSVRRLKGPQRPINAQQDRAAVLRALGCVDAVAIFDDDTPVPLLQHLRPDIFAKGGDYVAADIPEAEAMRAWGGRAVTLPYLDGRSTTRLLREVRHNAHT